MGYKIYEPKDVNWSIGSLKSQLESVNAGRLKIIMVKILTPLRKKLTMIRYIGTIRAILH